MRYLRRLPIYMFLTVIPLLFSLTGCSGTNSNSGHLNMADLADMPAQIRSAPVSVHTAYQFAVANPEILTQIPCYCGCGPIGHTSNYACYVAGENANGNIKFDNHALGCSICVDITQDIMRLKDGGSTTDEIRAYVDETYMRYGPSNMPPVD